MIDYNFPIISYDPKDSYYQWGFKHGKAFSEGIKELVTIRRKLMLKRNPSLEEHISELAQEQFTVTKEFDINLSSELEGIADGAELSLEDIVILNNYTDFRDIHLPEEGCSTIQVQNDESLLSGQTWDMHRSAKRFLCLIEVPKTKSNPETLVLSLVGCTGLMAINSEQCFVGVNNINTLNARVGLIWPNLVRKLMMNNSIEGMRDTLTSAPVTSGHNYLISTTKGSEHWEITPNNKDLVAKLDENQKGFSFHTNHCLGENVHLEEDKNNVSKTTHKRYEILDHSVKELQSFDDMKSLLQSHEQYPVSICTHLETGADDPSATCGGGIVNMKDGKVVFWRGCPEYDQNYIEYSYQFDLATKSFKRV
ncbi:C45 family peptidase [Halobacteriovorax sp. HLS]|uniref:C45 family autoproteolytic acyltransferase/hydolase n=1 Tax=Halobacteriovorax sp. HLS TaxID=2234000 RepID=UPI000FDAD5EE|nr:C45 family peptidase [Halobacteriovorax sp. HLS]